MKRPNWLVADGWIDPNGSPDHCSFCREEMGREHRDNCPARSRTVVMNLSYNIVVRVGEAWSINDLEIGFRQICADKHVDFLVACINRPESDCLCKDTKVTFVREATAEDETRQALWIGKVAS
ncbi:MAG TPA: hypothetical protein VHQ92_07220 [Pseudolabrys sp.]|nr:hypothetical protein [Pseudolabrys sp.]